ncbi:MAG: helix-turn-helix domain-containing protein [Dehalococcoidia bacterium]|nr:helix-turn-helix domain-containing protein [Dehalococcoidia bacterium]
MATKTANPLFGYAGLLTRREVAARFGVAPQTVTRWANEGILPSVRTLHGQRRYPADEVERLVSSMWKHAGASCDPPGRESAAGETEKG